MVVIFSVYYIGIFDFFNTFYFTHISFVVFQLGWFKSMMKFLLDFSIYLIIC